MGERKHKAEGGEKKAIQPQRKEEQEPGKKTNPQFTRPALQILQLQQIVGNKAVTKLVQRHKDMVQRHKDSTQERFRFLVRDEKTLEDQDLTGTGW